MRKEFRSIKDVLVSNKNSSILSELKRNTQNNQYWVDVINEILIKLPYQKTQGIKESIIRITESQSKYSPKKKQHKGTMLIVRLNSNSAVTRLKLIAPLILRELSKNGMQVVGIKPSISQSDIL
ncbi:MAG: hypothetical protein CBD16_06750 [Betaproteobacteria bacterium TMED156]|nr:MAG: hypothetical protein CBD16_06750 [Betaproteobacteria bacterium TMED156]